MRDPNGPDFLASLENFTDPGLAMNPLPASEVRRRGTRMRRRNNALAAIGGVAAVAIIATPLAMAATNNSTDTTPPVTNPSPSVTWVTEIPADFPLTAGMPGQPREQAAPAFGLIAMCGSTVWAEDDPASVDAVGATEGEEGTDGSANRSLVLYPSEADADRALAGLRAGVIDCPSDGNGSGATLLNEVVPADVGAEDSFVFTQQAEDGDLRFDLTTYVVARSGNALYLASSHTSAGGDQVASTEIQRLTDQSEEVVDAMCIFAADPC